MNIATDFDETLMNNAAAPHGYKMGPPEVGAISVLNKLVEEGHKIFIFTARNVQDQRVYKAVADWVEYFKIPCHGITNIKSPDFDIMIDNRGLHYQSWDQVYQDVHRAETHWKNWSDDVEQHGRIKDITQSLTDPKNQL